MKCILFCLSTLLFSAYCSAQGNYLLLIDGDSVLLDLEKPERYQSEDGTTLKLELKQPDVLTYVDDMVSFNYSKDYSVSNTEIEVGIEQCMIVKSTGNGFMLQKYSTMDPSMLAQLMVNELTKESVSYGYEKVEKDVNRKLVSGEEISGIEATLTYKGTTEIYTVYTWGGKDEGIIVVTMLLSEDYKEQDLPLINLFLNSLKLL